MQPATSAPHQRAVEPERGAQRALAAGPARESGLLRLNSKGCTHAIKLRDSLKLGPQTRLELGADLRFELHPGTGSAGLCAAGGSSPPARALRAVSPWWALQWQVDPEDKGAGVLRADPHHLSYGRRLCIGRKGARWSARLDAKLGLTYSGKPHVGIHFPSLPLTLGVAVGLLVAGKPVHLAHTEVGGLAVHVPLHVGGLAHGGSLQERVEVDATLRRRGRGLQLQLHKLNGVLRLREE